MAQNRFRSNDIDELLDGEQSNPQVTRRTLADVKSAIEIKTSGPVWWPQLCACCGSDPTTNAKIQYTRQTGQYGNRKLTTWRRTVPCCAVCKRHQSVRQGGTPFYLLLLLLGIGGSVVALGQLGTTGIPVVALCLLGTVMGFKWVNKQRVSKAESQMKPSCTGTLFVSYRVAHHSNWQPGSFEIFKFTNEKYAELFHEQNSGKWIQG